TIHCDIVSIDRDIYHGDAVLVVATGELGELGIAHHHAPLLTRLKPGKLVVTLPDGKRLDFAVSGGILEVQSKVVTILVDTAISAEDIDEAAVRAIKAEVEQEIASGSTAIDAASAKEKLVEANVQLQAVERLHHRSVSYDSGHDSAPGRNNRK
ncbi:MAG: F0F1 ATP synthase subunit epsilon, partial [Xanthomonadaceae bacterium]|nr:F0F1 ATP synthase subunit epsilon [Xanthomonadaceae bacterium]